MKTILIVGSSSSIGNAIINRFRSGTNRIIATYFKNNYFASGDNLFSIYLDLNNNESITSFVKEVDKITPNIDIAIFLSSILPGKNLSEYNNEEVDNVMTVNFIGQAKTILQLYRYFKPGSVILLLSSISAQKGSYDPIYAASKGAILSFVKSLATSMMPAVRINAIAPGLIQDSSMFQSMSPERREFHKTRIPNRNFLQINDLADIIFDLSQDHWGHLNGACIDLNGGQYVR